MGRGHPFCNSPQKIKLRPLALQPTANLHLPAVGGAGGQRKEPTAPAGSHRLFLCKTLFDAGKQQRKSVVLHHEQLNKTPVL